MRDPRRYFVSYVPGRTKNLTEKHYPFGHMNGLGDWFEVPEEIRDRVEYAIKRANAKYAHTPLYYVLEENFEDGKTICIQIGK